MEVREADRTAGKVMVRLEEQEAVGLAAAARAAAMLDWEVVVMVVEAREVEELVEASGLAAREERWEVATEDVAAAV